MKLNRMLKESFECVKINGILRNLTNDEMKIYKRIKDEGKLFKADLTEFEANVATYMVTKGLLIRKKAQQENGKHGRIYYVARGRNGRLKTKPLEEVAPPDKKIESWIKKNKKRFKDRYGAGYEKYLYGRAWKAYNGKLTESIDDDIDDISVSIYTENGGLYNGEEIEKVKPMISELLDFMNREINRAESSDSTGWRKDSERKKAYIRICDALMEKGFFYDTEPASLVSKNFVINGKDDLYNDYLEPFKDRIYDDAIESGDYNQYSEREYNSDSTWEAIYDYGDISLIDDYNDFGDFEDFTDDILENLDKVIEVIENPQINYIPWSGDESEEINQQQVQAANNQKRAEVIENLKHKFSNVYEIRELVRSLLDAREIPNRNQLNAIENFCSNYEFYHNRAPAQEFDSILSTESINQINDSLHKLEDNWESYRDRARDDAIESGDFDQYDDGEYDADATSEEVYSHSLNELIDSLSYENSYYKRILEIKKIFEKIAELINKDDSMVSTGAEFDESVSYKF